MKRYQGRALARINTKSGNRFIRNMIRWYNGELRCKPRVANYHKDTKSDSPCSALVPQADRSATAGSIRNSGPMTSRLKGRTNCGGYIIPETNINMKLTFFLTFWILFDTSHYWYSRSMRVFWWFSRVKKKHWSATQKKTQLENKKRISRRHKQGPGWVGWRIHNSTVDGLKKW